MSFFDTLGGHPHPSHSLNKNSDIDQISILDLAYDQR